LKIHSHHYIVWTTVDQQDKLQKRFQRRAAIDHINDYLKIDHRLNRNFYKEIIGDNINVMLAAAAFNFKRIMNKWKSSFYLEFKIQIIDLINSMSCQINNKIILKGAF
jgi:IS5 family transposase